MDNSPFVELDFVIDFEIILCPKTLLGSLGVWEFGSLDNSPSVELDFVIDFEIILCPKTFFGGV